MRRVLVLLVVVWLVAAACGGGAEKAQTPSSVPSPLPSRESLACNSSTGRPSLDRLDVAVGATTRSGLVHIPVGWDGRKAIPVVISFHGAGANATTMAMQDGLDAKADAEGFVVLRPEALTPDIDAKIHDVTWWDVTGRVVDEPAFVASLLDELGRRVCMDPSRVFATGFSVGAEMAMAAACALPDRIAAVAQVGAGRSVPCSSGRPTPALAFHGTDDLIVPYNGKPADGVLPAQELMGEQAQRNRCTTTPVTRPVSPTVEAITWNGCDAPTVLYRLHGHGHAWPGHPLPFDAQAVVGFLRGPDGQPNAAVAGSGLTIDAFAANLLLTNTDINATDVMWDFFTSVGHAEP